MMRLYKNGLYFLFAIIILISCRSKERYVPETKIAKTVPLNFVRNSDNKFSPHNDTMYYGGHFFTGFQYSLYKSGDTEFVRSYFNGVEEGPQRSWYENKQQNELRFYINGKKEGVQEGWWPNGKKRFIFIAQSDAYTGELKEWNMKGFLYKVFHYTNGNEEGSQRLWWEDGTVRANYVIRNGKRYGLLGIKLCSNPYDSITKK